MDDDDIDDIDINNYKGMFYEDENENEKYIDPITGAHF